MTEHKARALLFEACVALIMVQMKWDKKQAFHWMITDNPNLGGCAPQLLIVRGRSHKLLAFIETAIDEEKR